MNNLEKVLVYWADLDQSYEQHKDKLGVTTKLDYLKKLVSYDEKTNTTKVFRIKNKIQQDSENYNETQMKFVNVLDEVLSGIDTLLKEEHITEISSLAQVFGMAGTKTAQMKTLENRLPDDFFDSLLPVNIKQATKPKTQITLSESINSLGIVGECFKSNTNGDVVIYSDNDLLTHSFIYYNDSVINKIFENVGDKTFRTKVRDALIKLSELELAKPGMVFIDNEYYSREGNTLTLQFGNTIEDIKLTKRNTIDCNGTLAHIVKYKLKFDTVTIVCV